MTPVNPNTPSPLEQETGAIIRALQNRLINDNPLKRIEMIEFNTKEQVISTKINVVSKIEFIKILNNYKPKDIFNSHYSQTIPCWVILEYLGNNKVKYFAQGWADKTPVVEPMENLYNSWKLQGLDNCFFNDLIN